jgi:ADP-ribose pyrophosphatase YjhB (NUDIX family)
MTPLRQERDRLGWSRARLAHDLERRAQGRFTLATRRSLLRMISGWESGSRDTSEPYRTLLAEAYGRTPDELGMNGGTDRARSDIGLLYASSMSEALSVLSDLARFDDMGHVAVTQGRYQPDALNAACLDWLFGASAPAIEIRSQRQVTHHEVEEIRTTTEMFDGLDRKFGGEGCRGMAVKYLREAVLPRIDAVKNEATERELFRATAVLCELIGWMSYDTSRNSLAQRYFTQALRFAGAAGDRAYAAYVLSSMADQALFLQRTDQALRLAKVARDASERANVPVAMTEACMFEARAHAARGDASECKTALLQAEANYNRIASDESPTWASHWSEVLFASHAGTCWIDLDRPAQAEGLIQLVWDSAKDQTRRRVYSGVQLARIALLRGDADQASAYGIGALESTSGSTSHRSRQQLVDLRDRLKPHTNRSGVRVPGAGSTAPSKLTADGTHAVLIEYRKPVTLAEDLEAEGQPEREFHVGIASRLPRKRIASGALVRDASDRILFVVPAYKPYLDIPGGVAEEGESPLAACRREVQEEIGLGLTIGRLLVVDWIPAQGVWPDGVMFIFDGGHLTDKEATRLKPTDEELIGLKLLTFEQAEPSLRPSMARRVESAIDALKEDSPRYLEFGRP